MYEEKEIKYKKRKKESKKEQQPKPKVAKEKNVVKTTPTKKKEPISKKKKTTTIKTKPIKKQTKKKKFEFSITIPPIFKQIDYKLLFSKLGILLFIIFIIIFTISRIKKQQEKQFAVLNQNISTITNATLSYFNENPLPINIGDSTSFLLEEMKNLHYIGDIKDKEDKYCDTLDSFIILTKQKEDEYKLKIYLQCPKDKLQKEQIMVCTSNICTIKK